MKARKEVAMLLSASFNLISNRKRTLEWTYEDSITHSVLLSKVTFVLCTYFDLLVGLGSL